MENSRDDGATDGNDEYQSVFTEGEKVLACHSQVLYVAKVQKTEHDDNQQRYYVHYLGWSKSWDEWVGVDRLRKLTKENIEKQKELAGNMSFDKNIKAGRSISKSRKRKGDWTNEENSGSAKRRVKLNILPTLKRQLFDDYEFVTQLGKLVKLPRKPNVDDILKKYLTYRSQKDGLIVESLGEFLKGMRLYFDKALPLLLLYKREQRQYAKAIVNDVSPSSVYGAEHLLRLFVKLPDTLAYVSVEDDVSSQLQEKFNDFLKFLQKNQSTFFLSAYEIPFDFEE